MLPRLRSSADRIKSRSICSTADARLVPAGAVVGGFCFIVPGLVVILGLASVFLAARPPGWIQGGAEGAGAAVPAVAVAAAVGLLPGSWRRAGSRRAGRAHH